MSQSNSQPQGSQSLMSQSKCAVGTCRRPATLRLVSKDRIYLSLCAKHARTYRAMGYEVAR